LLVSLFWFNSSAFSITFSLTKLLKQIGCVFCSLERIGQTEVIVYWLPNVLFEDVGMIFFNILYIEDVVGNRITHAVPFFAGLPFGPLDCESNIQKVSSKWNMATEIPLAVNMP